MMCPADGFPEGKWQTWSLLLFGGPVAPVSQLTRVDPVGPVGPIGYLQED